MAAPPHVLIVDDDPRMVAMLERWLVRAEYRVTGVTTMQDALTALETLRPDWVLTDLMLPMGDGLDILAHALAQQPWVKVIVMTAFGSETARHRALTLGAHAFLSKPFNSQMLLNVLAGIPASPTARSQTPPSPPHSCNRG